MNFTGTVPQGATFSIVDVSSNPQTGNIYPVKNGFINLAPGTYTVYTVNSLAQGTELYLVTPHQQTFVVAQGRTAECSASYSHQTLDAATFEYHLSGIPSGQPLAIQRTLDDGLGWSVDAFDNLSSDQTVATVPSAAGMWTVPASGRYQFGGTIYDLAFSPSGQVNVGSGQVQVVTVTATPEPVP